MVKKILNQDKNKFWYFIIVAPILAKVIEWIFQIYGSGFAFMLIKSIWWINIIFIVSMAFFIFLFKGGLRKKLSNLQLASIVGIAYFLKEVYNFLFVFQTLNQAALIGLIIEPVFMYTVLGLWLPRLLKITGKK